ncbi:hypothetical protein QN277_019201 [Acacia crassicarpa]|uniref:RRM domain-containing protein n=1 Tax=Acacia crassicarpa TaxID=499986 RepID=A0AAE1MQ45_9FABA|nr:hypothetical protein QN277_019201 [Acacia crassicarpa]
MQVFSAFGFVHKITTFEKTARFQALVQFSDAETATSAKDALDGRSIPRYPNSQRVTYGQFIKASLLFSNCFVFYPSLCGAYSIRAVIYLAQISHALLK